MIMKQSRVSTFWKYLTYLFFGLVLSAPLVNVNANDDYDFSEEEIKKIFSEMETIVEARYTPQVRGHIVTYLKVNRDKTDRLLERASVYFPIIEKYIEEYELPEDIKYLAIIESALNPKARSRMGAVGLWQFMPYTGKEHGLRLYSSVDERRDPHKSTAAAMQYLTRLYNEFGDWALAMAAYNSGPGRVRSAIRRSGSKNFWELYRYLPRETRGYIPAFIAATYVFKHHQKFGFAMSAPAPDMLFTEHIMIYNKKITLDKIAEITGLDRSVVKALNPSYVYNYVPQSSYGYGLTLPKRVVGLMKQYLGDNGIQPLELAEESPSIEENNHGVLQESFTSLIIREKMHLNELAELYQLNPYQVKYWNGLNNMWLSQGAEIIVPLYFNDGQPILDWYERLEAVNQLPYINDVSPFAIEFKPIAQTLSNKEEDKIVVKEEVILRRGESIVDAMRRSDNRSSSEPSLFEASNMFKKSDANYSYGKKLTADK